MFFLFRDLLAHGFHMARTDRKRSIAVLPIEVGKRRPFRFDQLGRIAFQFLDEVSHRNRPPEQAQDMNMVRHPADPQHRTAELIARAAEILVSFVPYAIVLEMRAALFGGKDDMKVNLCEGLGHGNAFDETPSG
jgi:hypothetical protein